MHIYTCPSKISQRVNNMSLFSLCRNELTWLPGAHFWCLSFMHPTHTHSHICQSVCTISFDYDKNSNDITITHIWIWICLYIITWYRLLEICSRLTCSICHAFHRHRQSRIHFSFTYCNDKDERHFRFNNARLYTILY